MKTPPPSPTKPTIEEIERVLLYLSEIVRRERDDATDRDNMEVFAALYGTGFFRVLHPAIRDDIKRARDLILALYEEKEKGEKK